MSHLSMEQLLELREPGLEPGLATARAHLETCESCRAEADRLAQRIARLRALPAPRPSRNRFPEVRARLVGRQRLRRFGLVVTGTLALAASVALVVVTRPTSRDAPVNAAAPGGELDEVMSRSRELEAALDAYDPESRVLDGRTAGIAFRLEDQLSAVDRQLEMLNLMQLTQDDVRREQLRLWRERVGLLDALMDVHLTRATYAGM
jgi:hypothetical protein